VVQRQSETSARGSGFGLFYWLDRLEKGKPQTSQTGNISAKKGGKGPKKPESARLEKKEKIAGRAMFGVEKPGQPGGKRTSPPRCETKSKKKFA